MVRVKPYLPLCDLCAEIIAFGRQRKPLFRYELKLGQTIGAIRRGLSMNETRDRAATRASPVVAPEFAVIHLIEARKAIHPHRMAMERAMRSRARKLPVYAWVKRTLGISDLGLALIVACAGNLSLYATVSKLWKRMGLAVINGEAQGRRNDPNEAALHAFSPYRRAVMAAAADGMVQSMNPDYRAIYLARKAKARAEHPDWPAWKVDNYGKRIVAKELLKQLWVAWRDADQPMVDSHGSCERTEPAAHKPTRKPSTRPQTSRKRRDSRGCVGLQ